MSLNVCSSTLLIAQHLAPPLDLQGKLVAMGSPKEKRKVKPAKPQHDPTPEERDERVSLHPRKPDDVLRKLLRTPPKDRR
jgi:hypothetical protein